MRGWLVFVAACTACAQEDPPTLTVHAKGSSLVVARDGDARWKQLALDSEGTARFELTSGTFGVGHICPPDQFFSDAVFFFATEPHDVNFSCEQIQTPITVSGTTSPGAKLWIFGTAFVASNGTFTTKVPAGLHDVVAISNGVPKRILIRRQVDMTADLVLDIPVATEGVEMRAVTPTVIGAEPSTVTISADMNPGSPTVYFGSAATTIHVPPSSVLLASDRAAITAHTPACSVQQPLTDDTPTFQMPGGFTATVDRGRVRWTADPAVPWEQTRISFSGRDGTSGIDRISGATFIASSEWLTAMGYVDSFPLIDVKRMPGWIPQLGGFSTGTDVSFDVTSFVGRYDSDFIGCGAKGAFIW